MDTFEALLVGAGLAIVGGLIGQLVAFWLKREEAKREYRRDKLDQLVLALTEDRHWLDDYLSSQCFGDGEHTTIQPFNRARVTILLYFRQELGGSVLIPLLKSRHDYTMKIAAVRKDRLTRAIAAGRNPNLTLPDDAKTGEVTQAFDPYYKAMQTMLDACAKVAKDFA